MTRPFIYFLEKKGVIGPEKVEVSGPKTSGRAYFGRSYRQSDLRAIFAAGELSRRGLSLDKVIEGAKNHALLVNEDQIALGTSMIRIVKDLFLGAGPGATWDLVAEIAGTDLQCERCSVFLADPDDPTSFISRGISELGGQSGRPPAARPHASWTKLVAETGRPVNLVAETVTNYPGVIEAAGLFSLLAVPVRPAHAPARLRGWIVAENRVDRNRVTSEGCFFDPGLEKVGEVLASLASLILDLAPHLELRHGLRSAIEQQDSLDKFLHNALRFAVAVTGGSRGDVAWLDRRTGRAHVIAQFGKSELMSISDLISNRSVSRRVFETGKFRLIPDVRVDPDYHECSADTLSELCVPVFRPGERAVVGVINVESKELDHFSVGDLQLLEELAEYAALYGHVLETYDAIASSSSLTDGSHTDDAPDLRLLLKQISDEQHLDRGVAYLADYRHARLRCAAVLDFPEASSHRDEFEYGFAEPSFITKVFREQHVVFIAEAERELDVSKRDRALFGPKRSMVAIPLLFGPVVVGVVVAWSSQAGLPAPAHEQLMKRYSKLVTTSLAVAEAEKQQKAELQRHRDVLEAIRRVLAQMASQEAESAPERGTPRQDLLRDILNALIANDFERARLFEYDKGKRVFRCIDSVSRAPTERSYRDLELHVAKSPYAELTGGLEPKDWQATIRDPRVTHKVDPYADALNKRPFLPWAVAPLFVGGSLHGYIACDNAQTEKEIEQTDLEQLNVFASLAAQAVVAGRPR